MNASLDAILDFKMKKCVAIAALLLVLLFSVFAEDILFRNVRFSESEILSDEELRLIVDRCSAEYSGLELLKAIVGSINELYLQKGYPNARAYVPEQTVEDSTVFIELVEGRVGTITISGERRFTPERFILKSLNLDTNNVLNLAELERKLLIFNRWNTGVALTSTLNPGQEKPGTTDIDLNVTEQYPSGVSASFDNYATEATGSYRAGIRFASSSLTNNRDSLVAGAYMNFYSRSVYADYSLPAFGEIPSQAVILGIKGSYGSSEAAEGSASLFNIKSTSGSAAAYMDFILGRTVKSNTDLLLTGTYSRATTSALDTPLTTEALVSASAALNTVLTSGSFYLSASAGIVAGVPMESTASLNPYMKFAGNLSSRLSLGSDVYILASASGQWMPFNDVVPNQELLYAGGAATVRGYSEGCLWGKSGYTAGAEVHFMLPFDGNSSLFAFADHAGVFPYPDTGDHFLTGVGGGLEVYIGNIFHTKLCLALPLTEIEQDSSNGFRGYFSVTVSTPNKTV